MKVILILIYSIVNIREEQCFFQVADTFFDKSKVRLPSKLMLTNFSGEANAKALVFELLIPAILRYDKFTTKWLS